VNDINQAQDAEASAVKTANAGGDPAAALAAAEAKANENWNSYLRAVAEMDNFRKRTDREIDNARKYAIERFAQEMVNVGDSLEAGVQNGKEGAAQAIIEGAQATLKLLHNAFEKAGMKVIQPAVGEAFDPAWHEAMVAQESQQPANTIVSVIQKGYSLNNRLLRPARVIVSKSPGN
jgi:molecular chaperone GrpE